MLQKRKEEEERKKERLAAAKKKKGRYPRGKGGPSATLARDATNRSTLSKTKQLSSTQPGRREV